MAVLLSWVALEMTHKSPSWTLTVFAALFLLFGVADWLDDRGHDLVHPSERKLVARIRRFQGLVTTDADGRAVRVELGGTRFTDARLEHFKELTCLESLTLSGKRITDQGLMALAGMRSLKTLIILGTSVTEEGVDKIKQARPDLVVSNS